MELSKAELDVLVQIANGNTKVAEIARALQKDNSQIYRIGKKLSDKELLTLSKGSFQPVASVHANLLLQLLAELPSAAKPLSGSGIRILTSLLEPKTIDGLISDTSFKRSTVFKKLKEARHISMIHHFDNKYRLNDKLWQKAIDFLNESKSYEDHLDKRVPADSKIYFKNEKEILFSSKKEIDAALTAFSAYEKFGMKILNVKHHYYLPKRALTKREVFLHSLLIAQQENSYRLIVFVALFYLKHEKGLTKISNPVLENIKKVLEGSKIRDYPSLAEIKDRADVYDIRL